MAQKEKHGLGGLHRAPVVCWQSGGLQICGGTTWVTFSADDAALLRVRGDELAILRERIGECPGL